MYRQIMMKQAENKEKLKEHFPELREKSGIYIMTRYDENGFRYAYIGQSNKILTRIAQHIDGYQHIDLSLKKHGLYSDDNKYGWKIEALYMPETELNAAEQKYIKEYAEKGYQLRNKTSGSQGIGKMGLDIDKKEPKKYREGIRQGEKNARRYIAKLFEKDLKAEINGKVTKNKEKSYLRFYKYINIIEEENE